MTARLVALMSVVLFLSLLAFSFLLNHSRAAVLEEVERTVSKVGSETLTAVTGCPTERWAGEWMSLGTPLTHDEEVDLRIEMGPDAADANAARVAGSAPPPPPAPGALPQTLFIHEKRLEVVEFGERPTPEMLERLRHAGVAGAKFVLAHSEPSIHLLESDRTMQVAISFVRVNVPNAGDDAGAGGRGPAGPADRGAPPLDMTRGMMLPVSGAPFPAAFRDQVVFQVPVAAYEGVFDAIRERSLWISLAVFVVGVALSAALARRFTRPIRDLDRALERVSAGDLEVEVEPAGGGEVSRLAAAFNSMTSRLKANRERERDMSRREKLSALGRLAAGVAHDVRNPLHSIGLVLQHLEDTATPEREDARTAFGRAITLIRREIKRLDGLVANFLAFAKNEAAERRPVQLAELAHETAQLVAKEAERRGVTIDVDAGDSLPPIEASQEALRSALLNLVLNALEATPKDGRVTIVVRGENGMQKIEVSDTGRGIPDADKERVFEFGFTTRDDGHGLGLAMVHHTIVEEHGGRVTLESDSGTGTRVRLELPDGSPA